MCSYMLSYTLGPKVWDHFREVVNKYNWFIRYMSIHVNTNIFYHWMSVHTCNFMRCCVRSRSVSNQSLFSRTTQMITDDVVFSFSSTTGYQGVNSIFKGPLQSVFFKSVCHITKTQMFQRYRLESLLLSTLTFKVTWHFPSAAPAVYLKLCGLGLFCRCWDLIRIHIC